MDRLRMLTKDETAEVFAEQMEKNRMDAVSHLMAAEERGLEKGMEKGLEKGLSRGREEGRQKGREEGMQRGREEGLEKGLERAALQMLKLGYDLSQVQEAVNLPEERLRKLQKQSDNDGGGSDA